MMKIIIDTEAVLLFASGFREIKADLHYEMMRISQLIMSLEGEWKGDAQKAFFKNFVYAIKQYEELEKICDELAEILDISANLYAKIDNEIKLKIQNSEEELLW